MKYKNTICFGEVLWDMLPSGAKPGGAPLNVAIHLKRQGLQTTLISRVGEDSDGVELENFLKQSGVKTEFIQKDRQLPTSTVLVHLDESGNATYEICEPVAWDNIEMNSVIEKEARRADLIIYGSLASRNKATRATLLHILNATTGTRLVDVNLRAPYDSREWIEELLHISDFAKLNNDELKKLADWNSVTGNETDLIKWLSSFFGCHTVCVTRGEHGAMLLIDNKIHEHPGFKTDAVDTVGAGDSFLASLIAGLSKNISPEKALETACATGAFVTSQSGAVPHYSANEIARIISAQV